MFSGSLERGRVWQGERPIRVGEAEGRGRRREGGL